MTAETDVGWAAWKSGSKVPTDHLSARLSHSSFKRLISILSNQLSDRRNGVAQARQLERKPHMLDTF